MLVYRVAHATEKRYGFPMGPYNGAVPVMKDDEKINWAHQDDNHPSPRMDGVSISVDEYCGLASMERLRDWFDGWLGILGAQGFRIFVYEVPENLVKQGRKQLVFPLAEAKLVRTEPCIEED
jgi:hypothetical protein